MTGERVRAVLVHASAGRARVRIDGRHDDPAFFAGLADALCQHTAVREVRASALTGSLLILHDGPLEPILEHARERGLIEVERSRPSRASLRELRQVVERVDAKIASETDDALSLRKVAFASLIGAGLWQARNGHFLPAGMTLFNYALAVLGRVVEDESTNYPQKYPQGPGGVSEP